jgi:hypothetical protein
MTSKTRAALAAAAIVCPLIAHAQSVSIIGEGSGAARNTTGASASKNTTGEESPAATTVITPARPTDAGRSSGTEIGQNTGTTGGGGTSAGSVGGGTAAAPAGSGGGGGAGAR